MNLFASVSSIFRKPKMQMVKEMKIPEPIWVGHIDGETIVIWDDRTRTSVKLKPGEFYDEHTAFCAAVVKKLYGTNSAIKRNIKNLTNRNYPGLRSEIAKLDINLLMAQFGVKTSSIDASKSNLVSPTVIAFDKAKY